VMSQNHTNSPATSVFHKFHFHCNFMDMRGKNVRRKEGELNECNFVF
jgi:hypothetical protein